MYQVPLHIISDLPTNCYMQGKKKEALQKMLECQPPLPLDATAASGWPWQDLSPKLPTGEWFYSLRPRLVATCCNTSICLMASLRVKWTTSTQ